MVIRRLKSISKPLLYSIVAHIILFIFLSNNTTNIPYKKTLSKDIPIKSYLYYRAPITNTKSKPERQKKNTAQLAASAEIIKEAQQHKTSKPIKNQATSQSESQPMVQSIPQPIPKITTLNQVSKTKKITDRHIESLKGYQPAEPQYNELSPKEHLAQLRTSMNKQALKASTYSSKENQNLTIFNPSPKLVPKSVNKASTAEIIKKNTTQYSNELAIIKHDNGTCTIKQDLSQVGMEGITSTQHFKCGESKFDQSFRLHMKNVRERMDY